MARLVPLWMQNGSYPSALDRRLIGAAWPAGGVSGMIPTVNVGTMNISITLGVAVVPDSRVPGAAYLCVADNFEIVPLPPAPPSGLDRIDLIVVRPRDSAYVGSDTDWIFDVISGTPSATPGTPAVPAGTMAIVQQRVIGGTAGNTAANMIDRRLPLAPGPIGNIGTANGPATQQDYVAGGGFPVTLPFTARAGRRYRVHGYCLGQQQTAPTTLAQITLRAGGFNRFIWYTNVVALPTLSWVAGAAWIDIVPAVTGPVTCDINITAAQGAMRVRANEANLSIDDIGPA